MAKAPANHNITEDPFKYDKHGNPRIWTISFLSVMCVSLFTWACMEMGNAALPFFIKNVLSGNERITGSLRSVFMLSAVFGRFFVGRLVDKYGRKPVILFGIGMQGVMTFFFGSITSIPMLFIFRGFQGIGFAGQTVAINTAITDMLPEDRLSEGIGYNGLSQSISQAIGPGVAVMIMDSIGYTRIFSIFSIFSFLSLFVACTLNVNKFRLAKQRITLEQKIIMDDASVEENEKPTIIQPVEEYTGIMKYISRIVEPKSVIPALCPAFNGLANTTINTFLLLYGRDTLLIEGFALFSTVQAVSIASSRLLGGRLVGRFGLRRIVIPALAVNACCLISISYLAKTLPMFLVIAALYGFCTGLIQPVFNATTIIVAPFERRGVASSTYFNFLDIGNAVGGVLWGSIAVQAGLQNIFALSALSLVVAAGIFYYATGYIEMPMRKIQQPG